MILHRTLNLYANGRAHRHTQNEKPIFCGIPDMQNEFLILYEKNIYYKIKFHVVCLLVRTVTRFTEPHTK